MTGNCWLGLTDDMPVEVDKVIRATAARNKVGLFTFGLLTCFSFIDHFYLKP